MRRVVLLCLSAVLAAPVAAGAAELVTNDGTLTVNNAEGRVHFQKSFSGIVLGRITVGALEVVNPDADCFDLLVWDDDDVRELPLRGSRDGVRCVFRTIDRTTPMRFRMVREGDEIVVRGSGIWLSAVGQGKVFVQGAKDKARDGTYAVNGERRGSLPDSGRTIQLGSPRATSLP